MDGHIKSCIMGRSETIPIVEGEVILGEFGRIYFAAPSFFVKTVFPQDF